jgi:hypothetical protein
LFFNTDGTIQKVTPTLRGVGLTNASDKIQIDRYSRISNKGASVEFIDSLNTFEGWKTVLGSDGAWVQYNAVDFGNKKYKTVQIKAYSQKGGTLQISLDRKDGTILSEIKISKCIEWNTIDATVVDIQPGTHNLILLLKDNNPVEIDWIRFKN